MYTYEIFFCVNNQYSTVSDQRSKCRCSREYPPCPVSRLRGPDQLDQRGQVTSLVVVAALPVVSRGHRTSDRSEGQQDQNRWPFAYQRCHVLLCE